MKKKNRPVRIRKLWGFRLGRTSAFHTLLMSDGSIVCTCPTYLVSCYHKRGIQSGANTVTFADFVIEYRGNRVVNNSTKSTTAGKPKKHTATVQTTTKTTRVFRFD